MSASAQDENREKVAAYTGCGARLIHHNRKVQFIMTSSTSTNTDRPQVVSDSNNAPRGPNFKTVDVTENPWQLYVLGRTQPFRVILVPAVIRRAATYHLLYDQG